MNTHRYLRFAQTLALVALAPACVVGDDPEDEPAPSAETAAVATTLPAPEKADGSTAPNEKPVAQVPEERAPARPGVTHPRKGAPHSSGPIVPPELPRGFA